MDPAHLALLTKYLCIYRYSLYSQNVNLYLAPTADARDTWLPLMQTIGCESRAFVLSANQCIRQHSLPDWIQNKSFHDTATAHSTGRARPMTSARRGSIITKTEDNHEITWPIPRGDSRASRTEISQTNGTTEIRSQSESKSASSRPPRRLSTVTKTTENHELVLPRPISPTTPSVSSKHDPFSISQDDNPFVCRGGSCIVSPMGAVLAGPLWEVEDGGLLIVDADFEDCERGRLDLDVAGSYSRNDAFRLEVEGLDINPPP